MLVRFVVNLAPGESPPQGYPLMFLLEYPGNPKDPSFVEGVKQWVTASGLTAPNVKYKMLAFAETNMPVAYVPYAPTPHLSGRGVVAGQPTGTPQGGQGNRPEGERDNLGFQPLGDGALDAAPDSFYGDVKDGTFSDLVMGPGGSQQEIPRDGI